MQQHIVEHKSPKTPHCAEGSRGLGPFETRLCAKIGTKTIFSGATTDLHGLLIGKEATCRLAPAGRPGKSRVRIRTAGCTRSLAMFAANTRATAAAAASGGFVLQTPWDQSPLFWVISRKRRRK